MKESKLQILSRILALIISFLWLYAIYMILQIKPEYPTRYYLQRQEQQGNKTGIVRMSTLTLTSPNSQNNSQQKEKLKYFDLLYLTKQTLPSCLSQLHILIINANNRQIGDSYLTIYKQIQSHNHNCKFHIYQLHSKQFLLMNTDNLIHSYAKDVINAVQFIQQNIGHQKLNLFAFQQGCSILGKVLNIIDLKLIKSLSKIIFINAYNPNLKIIYESPKNFFISLQHQLFNDKERMKTLNQTRLIFFSTLNYHDQVFHKPQDQDKFNFVWSGKSLRNTIFLNTRFIKTIYSLLTPKDYFSYTNFVNKLVDFLILDSIKPMKIQEIETYFYYGMIDLQPITLPQQNLRQTSIQRHIKMQEQGLIYSFDRTQSGKINFQKNFHLQSHILLIIASQQTILLNTQNQKIQQSYKRYNKNYFIIEDLNDNMEFLFLDPTENLVLVVLLLIHAPGTFPIRYEFFKLIKSYINENTNKPEIEKQVEYWTHPHRLIKVCPTGHLLLFPQHYSLYFQRTDKIGWMINNMYDYLITQYEKYTHRYYPHQCYPDFITQLTQYPTYLITHWETQRNLVIFITFSSYILGKKIRYNFIFFYILLIISQFIITKQIFQEIFKETFVNLTVFFACICLQFMMAVAVYLSSFAQEMIDIKYRQFMILITLAFAALKAMLDLQWVYYFSVWKLFCICLIFVINSKNILIVVVKIYFLSDNIIHNHSDNIELITLLLWIYITLQNNEEKQKIIAFFQQKIKQPEYKKVLKKFVQEKKIQQEKSFKIVDTLLICSLCYFAGGPSYMINICLSAYVFSQAIKIPMSMGKKI